MTDPSTPDILGLAAPDPVQPALPEIGAGPEAATHRDMQVVDGPVVYAWVALGHRGRA
mgnify:CR=1 FL=1